MRQVPLLLVILLILIPFTLSGQQVDEDGGAEGSGASWQIVIFPGLGEEALAGIQRFIDDGLVPAGFEILSDASLQVLFVRSPDVRIGRWAIVDYDDFGALESEITAAMGDGFVPMDISRYGKALAVLWIETKDITVEAWRIHTSPDTKAGTLTAIQQFATEQFAVWGISRHEDLVWYLFLRQSMVVPGGRIMMYPANGALVSAGIEESGMDGWLPTGIAAAGPSVGISYGRRVRQIR